MDMGVSPNRQNDLCLTADWRDRRHATSLRERVE